MEILSGLAAIPWFTFGPWDIGPLTVQGFGLLVAIGVICGYQIASWRAPQLGIDPEKLQSLILHMLITGFLGSHVLDLILYEPEKLLQDPTILFKFGSTLSSYGGIISCVLGMYIWKWRNPGQSVMAYVDVATFALPVGWFFGRMGCAVVHDHPGTPTDFALGVVYPRNRINMSTETLEKTITEKGMQIADVITPEGVAIHDLGLYEAIWWTVIIAVFLALFLTNKDRTRLRPGFYLYLLPLLYTPVRFSLDFLRTVDARYFGLTPAQYISMFFFVWGAYNMWRWTQKKTIQLNPRRVAAAAEKLANKEETKKEETKTDETEKDEAEKDETDE